MAIIGNSNSAVYLYPNTGTQLIKGNVNGYAALGNGEYAAVYGPGPYAFSIIVTGEVQSGGASSLDGGIVLGGPGIINNQGTIEGGAGLLVNGYAYGGATYLKNSGLIEGRVGAAVYTYGRGAVNNSGRIIGGSNGVYLSGGGDVANSGTISGGTGIGDATYYGTAYVSNSGLIRGTSTDGVFVLGTVINDPSGTITGSEVGINLYGGGTLSNTKGVITGGITGVAVYGYGNAYYGDAPASVFNTGSIGGGGVGVFIGPNHTLSTNIYNASGSRITGGSYGVEVYGTGIASINNAGVIIGSTGSGILIATGDVVNSGTISAGGSAGYGVIAVGATTIYNLGDISASGTAIALAGGGVVVDEGDISGSSAGIVFANGYANQLTLFTSGAIEGAVNLYGKLELTGGGQTGTLHLKQISNATSIEISDNSDWKISGTIATTADLFNSGTVTGPGTGIALKGGHAIYNYGSISGVSGISTSGYYVYNSSNISASEASGTGVVLSAPGYVINAASGIITGATGVALFKNTSIYNYGFVSGVTSTGAAGVYNYAGATIAGAVDGVFLRSGTVTDYGLIRGGTYAVDFGNSSANLLALGSTATLSGGAYLGGGGIELLDNRKPGTFVAANFKDFSDLTLAASADWDIIGSLASDISVTNNGTVEGNSAKNLTIAGVLSGTGTIDMPANLVLGGAVSAGQHIAFTSTNQTLNVGNAIAFSGKLDNFAAGDTIDLSGINLASITATHFAGGVLTLTETSGSLALTFANPKDFGTSTLSLFADGPGTGISLASTVLASALTTQNSAGWVGNSLVQPTLTAMNLMTLQS